MKLSIPQYLLLQNLYHSRGGIYLAPAQAEVRRLLKKQAIERVPNQMIWGKLTRYRITANGRKAFDKMHKALDEQMIAEALERHG